MSGPLMRKNFRDFYGVLIGFMALLAMYFVIIIDMYDPQDADIIGRLAGMKLSPELLSAFGFSLAAPGLTGFLANYLYGFLMLAFPMLMGVLLANRLVAALVDKGSLAAILASPITRRRFALTQAAFHLLMLCCLVGFTMLVGLAYSAVRFPGLIDIPAFLRVNLGLMLVQAAVGGLCFFASCLFNLSARSYALGGGLSAFFLIVQLLVNASPRLNNLKYLTLFSLFKPAALAAGEGQALPLIALFCLSLALYLAGLWIFDKKDLPI